MKRESMITDRKTIRTIGKHRIDKVVVKKEAVYARIFRQTVFYNCYREQTLASVYCDLTSALQWASNSERLLA